MQKWVKCNVYLTWLELVKRLEPGDGCLQGGLELPGLRGAALRPPRVLPLRGLPALLRILGRRGWRGEKSSLEPRRALRRRPERGRLRLPPRQGEGLAVPAPHRISNHSFLLNNNKCYILKTRRIWFFFSSNCYLWIIRIIIELQMCLVRIGRDL